MPQGAVGPGRPLRADWEPESPASSPTAVTIPCGRPLADPRPYAATRRWGRSIAEGEGVAARRARAAIAEALREHAQFAEFSAVELERLAPIFSWQEYAPGALIARAGERNDRALLVLHSGRVEVSQARDGASVVLGEIQARACVGEDAFVHGRPRSADVRAATRVRALVTFPERLEMIPKQHGLLRLMLLDALRRPEGAEALGLKRMGDDARARGPGWTLVPVLVASALLGLLVGWLS